MKVLVSGCFDLLHSGHVKFFEEAAAYGQLHVSVGSDETLLALKGRLPVNSEGERLFMIKSIRHVHDAFVARSPLHGSIDFSDEAKALKPDVFVVNSDGHSAAKQEFVEQELGARYVILAREPAASLPARSTTDLRKMDLLPFRLDLAGGWLDQPFVNCMAGGPVVTLGIEPSHQFNARSGMASSTRRTAAKLFAVAPFLSSASYTYWNDRPTSNDEALAKSAWLLFCADNPPGSKIVSGSQDAIGLVFPGLACSHYANGEYWPLKIDRCMTAGVLDFVQRAIRLVPLSPRVEEFDVLASKQITKPACQRLADAASNCWTALVAQHLQKFGQSVRASFEAQLELFPDMMTEQTRVLLNEVSGLPGVVGWKLSGAGGGGYLILVVDETSFVDRDLYLKILVRR